MKSHLIARLAAVITALMLTSNSAQAQDGVTGKAHGDWNAACDPAVEGMRKCAIWQVIAAEKDGPRLLHVEISYRRPVAAADGVELLLILPLGISLREDPALHIDDEFVKNLKVDYCVSDGCYVRSSMSAQLLERFLRMSGATLKVKSAAAESISLPISGSGSRAAFNSTE